MIQMQNKNSIAIEKSFVSNLECFVRLVVEFQN